MDPGPLILQGAGLAKELGHISGCFGEKTGLASDEIAAMRDDLIALRNRLRNRGSNRTSGPDPST